MKGDVRDIVGGGIVVLVGIAALVMALGYNIGTAQQMGPGYFPLVISAFLIIMGLSIMVLALARTGEMPVPNWRPAIAVLASVLVFALTIERLGLIPAVFGTVIVSSWAVYRHLTGSTLLLAAGLSVGCWVVFNKLLGLPMRPFIWPF